MSKKYVELGPNDYLFGELFGVYFYEKKLDMDFLKKSLDETLKILPILSSQVVKVNDRYKFEIVEPSNVVIYEKHDIEEDLHTYFLPDQSGCCNPKEGGHFYKLAECVEETGHPRVPKLNVPLLKLTVLHTKKNKSVLCVSINHALCDAHAFGMLMNAFAEGENRIIKEFTLSRKGLEMTDGFEMYKMYRPEMEYLKEFHPLKKVFEEDIGVIVTSDTESVHKILHFSAKKLEEMKKDASDPNLRISSNDCIGAQLWKLNTILYGKKSRSKIVPFKQVVNLRPRFSKIDETFFGNALTVTSMDYSYESIMSASYKDLVGRVRWLVNNVDEKL